MLKKIVSAAIIIMSGLAVMAQAPSSEEEFKKLTDFLPPSPNAASIIKEGELSANGNNGVASFNIGLLGLNAKNLAVNVGIAYSATGIKVDEIASRVGMGWSLQAGGVITRMMRGKPDEFNTRRWPWAPVSVNWATYNFFSSVAETPQTNSYDSEPDVFNFNAGGVSGSFVIGDTGEIVQNKETGLVIQTNFASSEWNFKITATDGTMYYFGGTGAKELSKRTSICGKTYDQFWPTAWYLKKIEEPNGNKISFVYEEIDFDYETGVSQSASTAGLLGQELCTGSIPCPGTFYSDCINANYVQGVLLTAIIRNSDSSRINFTYTTRQDCDDKLLSWVELVNSSDKSIKRYQLLYDEVVGQSFNAHEPGETDVSVTPYLKELRLWDSSNTVYQTHKFQYNDPESRPQRLAYSQDHWGYFNGINNTTLIPTPVSAYERQELSLANANRSVNFTYASKGILNKIQYPTGAVDSIVYEPNIFTGTGRTSIHQADCQSTGTGFSTQVVKTIPFTGSAIALEMACLDNSGTGSFDPVHNKGTVEITDSAGAVLYSKLFSPGQNFNINLEEEGVSIDDTTQFYVKIYANGAVVTTWARITFYPNTGKIPQQDLVGGLRVKSVFTNDGLGNINSKLYKYERLGSPDTSSLIKYLKPYYRKVHNQLSFVSCGSGDSWLLAIDCKRITYDNNTQVGLFDFSGSPVSYHHVIEAADHRYTTGATETKFGVLADAQGWFLYGYDDQLPPPVSNLSSLLNGVELEKNIYRRNEITNNLEPVSKTNNTYSLKNLKSVFGYQVHRRGNGNLGVPTDTVTVLPPLSACSNNNVQCQTLLFNAAKYEFLSATVNQQKQEQIQYSQENGGTPLVTKTTNYFDTNQPWLLAKSETHSSTRQATDTRYTYPKDHTDQTIYQQMVAQNKTTSPVTIGNYLRNDQQSLTNINYANWGSNNLMPDTITRSILENAFDMEGAITQRDSKGNILELVGRDGVVKSFIWGYRKEYPVAAITGASYSTAIAQLTVSLSTLETLDGTALLTETNKIRTGLSNAFVTTYTYIPLIGLKSETDANNRTTTYEYDAYNRLAVIRDHDGNIVKSINYNYNGTRDSLLTSNANIYFNQTTYSKFACQNCMSGYIGDSITYTVPAGTYFSKTSQADANTLAQAEVTAKGQQNANLKGMCKSVYSASCGSPDKKRIGCTCETGVKVYTRQSQSGNSYTCYFYYRWSDGSQSSEYSETSSVPCSLGGGIED